MSDPAYTCTEFSLDGFGADKDLVDEARELLSRGPDACYDVSSMSDEEVLRAVELDLDPLLPLVDERSGVDELHFDGTRLAWRRGGTTVARWKARAGKEGFQAPEHQDARDKGPLPPGRYHARQSRYQEKPEFGLYDSIKCRVGGTAWPGCEESWGRQRIWLEPFDGNEMHGRGKFTIHGGDDFFSRGCIDLSTGMADFARRFRAHGRDMVVVVEYPQR